MSDNNMVQIVLASDENYAEFVASALVSLFETSNAEITVHLLSNSISDDSIKSIQNCIPSDRGFLLVYDISNLSELLGIRVSSCIALSAYARLFIQKLLPESVDKVLYIDSDIIFNHDVVELWNENVEDCWVAGVIDAWFGNKTKTEIGLQKSAPYLNSGMLLINLIAWREENLLQRALDFLVAHNGVVYHSDQGVINAICYNHVKLLSPRFNLTSNYLAFPYNYLSGHINPFYTQEVYNEALEKPVCIHFTPGLYGRPWVEGCTHPFLEKYQYAHNQTEWKANPLRKSTDSLTYRFVKWTFKHLPLWCYTVLTNVIDRLLMVVISMKKK